MNRLNGGTLENVGEYAAWLLAATIIFNLLYILVLPKIIQ